MLLAIAPFCLAWLVCLSRTCFRISGLIKSNRARKCRPMKRVAGVSPVVLCGVFLYFIKNLESLVCVEPVSSFIDVRDCLRVWMNLSSKPLVAGWYGADVVRLTPFFFRNSWNSSVCCELWPIIVDKLFWQRISSKHCSQGFNCFGGGSFRVHDYYFCSFRMNIHNH